MRRRHALGLIGVVVAVRSGCAVAAGDGFRLAIGQRGNWENSVCELGQNAGFFKKHAGAGEAGAGRVLSEEES